MFLFYVHTKLFQKRGHYSRGDNIRGRTLIKKIRYIFSRCFGAKREGGMVCDSHQLSSFGYFDKNFFSFYVFKWKKKENVIVIFNKNYLMTLFFLEKRRKFIHHNLTIEFFSLCLFYSRTFICSHQCRKKSYTMKVKTVCKIQYMYTQNLKPLNLSYK